MNHGYGRFLSGLWLIGALCYFSIAANSAWAAEDPVSLLRGITDSVLVELRQHRQELREHPSRIYNVAEHLIVPHVDFVEMGRWIAGRNAWGKANEPDRAAFIKEFKTLVVRTYATSLLQYTDQKVDFMDLRGGSEGKERVQVSSYIRENGKAPIRMDYRLLKTGSGWKLYDIIIEGVSLLKGYQAQFSSDIRQQGLGFVVQKIREHNVAHRK